MVAVEGEWSESVVVSIHETVREWQMKFHEQAHPVLPVCPASALGPLGVAPEEAPLLAGVPERLAEQPQLQVPPAVVEHEQGEAASGSHRHHRHHQNDRTPVSECFQGIRQWERRDRHSCQVDVWNPHHHRRLHQQVLHIS